MSKSARERAREWLERLASGQHSHWNYDELATLLRDLLAEADALADDLKQEETTSEIARENTAAARAEAEAWRAKFEAVLQEARCWAGEAKTQRATVNEVGSVLGGVPDWGPIATKVAALRARLERAEEVCKEAKHVDGYDFLHDAIEAWEALQP